MPECYESAELGRRLKKLDLKMYENTDIFKQLYSFSFTGDVLFGLCSALNVH